MQMIFSLYGLLLYANLRSGIYTHLRLRKISKTSIRKNQKGFRNYWFYQNIQKNYGLGLAYGLNVAYLLTWLLHLAMALLGLILPWLQLPVLLCASLLCLIELPAVFWAAGNEYRAEFGSSFILLARKKETGKFCSSLIDLFAWCFSAFVLYISYRGVL